MDPITQAFIQGAAGVSGGATYVDDVYSTYLYEGQNSTLTVNNGIDLLGEGGLVWIKNRDNARSHILYTTAFLDSGSTTSTKKILQANTQSGLQDYGANATLTFANNGWSVLNGDGDINQGGFGSFASWNFRKQKGFFDIVTFQQSGADSQTTPQVVPHNLGSAPGMILLKKTSGDRDWFVYHRDLGKDYWMKLNTTTAAVNENNSWGTTTPDANNFGYMSGYIGGGGGSAQFVAYLFAGGASTAATARSVQLDGNDEVEAPSSTDFDFGSGDFTMECWVKHDSSSGNQVYLNRSAPSASSNSSWLLFGNASGNVDFYATYSTGWSFQMSAPATINDKSWHHIAVVRDGTNIKIYVDGTLSKTQSIGSNAFPASTRIVEIGSQWNSAHFTGKISNVRIVKGTAVYTSSFNPPTEPLTNITNTKLLCCQSSTVTAATVTPGTLTTTGDPTASTDSPFDDPEGFKFGEDGDQNVIKTGSYVGNGSSTGPEINVGFEPQWILIKNASAGQNWQMLDNMRGITTGGNDGLLYPSGTWDEDQIDFIDLTSTGFKVTHSDASINGSGNTMIYIAIRGSDGYVGKPAEAGTDVFAMDAGAGSSTIPTYDSGFPVDFQLMRKPAASDNWYTGARLSGNKYLLTNSSDAEASASTWVFDSNTGWSTSYGSTYQSWMWKRHAGFDVVTYKGDHVDNRQIPHSLSKSPEMIWTKCRDTTDNWVVWHTGMPNSGDGENATAHMLLNLTNATGHAGLIYGGTDAVTPTSTHWSVGTHETINDDRYDYTAMLFASVDGISKCGSYTGNGSASGPTITLGFSPRFILIKCTTGGTNWFVYDTLRGLTSGNDQRIELNTGGNQGAADDIDPTATGFQVVSTWDQLNGNTQNYLYYAHV